MRGQPEQGRTLTVSAPRQRVRGPRISEIRPKRVEAWLSGLPQASAEDSQQQILQALFVQNRTELEPDNRLSLMEMYYSSVLNIMASLNQSFSSASYPLTERQYALAGSVQQLCLELANGYKIVVNDFALHDNIRRNKAEFVLAVQRSTDVLSRVLINAYSTYRPCPEGVWRELHQLYRIAETRDVVNYPVGDISNEWLGSGVSMLDSYHRALLMGACNPYGLMQGECDGLFKLIPQWHSRVQVGPNHGKTRKHGVGYFLVNLLADSAPVPVVKVASDDIRSGNGEHLRLVNTLDVVREIHTVLQGKNSGQRDGRNDRALRAEEGVNVDLLRRFGRVLGGVNIVRRSTRTTSSETIPICVGMSGTHFFASGQRHFEPDSKRFWYGNASQQTPGREYFDLTDPAVGSKQERKPSLDESPENWRNSTVYRLCSCTVKDQSATGLCVRLEKPTEPRIRVGDLIGMQFPTRDRWRVGTIRWLKGAAESELLVGIQMLAPNLSPVAVKNGSKRRQGNGFVQALLLPGNTALKQPESLLVPRGTYRKGDSLELMRPSGKTTTITPLRLLDCTGSYDQLLIGPLDPDA